MVGETLDEPVRADPVVGFHPLHHLDRERQPGQPGPAGGGVGQGEAGGRGVPDHGLRAEVVVHPLQQVRFHPAGQVRVPKRAARVVRVAGGPDQAGGAGAEHVGGFDGVHRVDRGQPGQCLGRREPVAGVVAVQPYPVRRQVEDVGDAGAVHVGQPQPPRVEQFLRVEPGSAVHGDPRAEPPVADVGVVADLAVADADEIGQAVAGHVGQVHAVGAVGQQQPRPAVLVGGGGHGDPGAETRPAQRRVPGQGLGLGDQQVGQPVTIEVDQAGRRGRRGPRPAGTAAAATAASPRPGCGTAARPCRSSP